MKLVLASLLINFSLQAHTPFSSRISHRNQVSSQHRSSHIDALSFSSTPGSSYSVPQSSPGSSSSIPFVSHGSSSSSFIPYVSHGSSYAAARPHISHGASYLAPHGSQSSSYSVPVSSYSIPHVSSFSAPPSIPVVSYSQPVQQYRSEPGPRVVCKIVTERRCNPKLKLERVPDKRIVMKDVLLDEPDQINGVNELYEQVEEDVVFNTSQAIPSPVNRTFKNIFYQEVSKVIATTIDVVKTSQEPPTTQSVRVPGFKWVCPPGDEGINYETSFIPLLPNPLQDGTRNVLNLTVPDGLKDCWREEETATMDVTIPGKTSYELVQEPRAVNIKELERKEDPFTIFEILYKPGSVPKREIVSKFVSIILFFF